MVVKPVGAHGFSPVARNLLDTALAIGAARPPVAGLCVDGVGSRQGDRPSVVIKLTREKERVGKAIALRRVVAVVFVGGQRMHAETAVLGDVDGERVVLPHHHRFAISNLEQLGRKRSIESPDGRGRLLGHGRMKLDRDSERCSFGSGIARRVVIQTLVAKFPHSIVVILLVIPQATIGSSPGRRCLVKGLRLEFLPALV